MAANADRIPGIGIDVEDLIAVRANLSGLSLQQLQRRASYRFGAREVRIRGRGMEYEESRAYVSGDDFRTMDWRVMARTGEAHTKIFAEEKEHRFLLAVDLSASMFFGTRHSFKSCCAAAVAAHIGWLASFAGERIGGIVVSPERHHEVRPGKTRSGLLGVFHHLAQVSGIELPPRNKQSRLNFLLRELNRVVKPGSLVALISDFIGADDLSLELLSTLCRHNDVSAFWIHDDTETRPWPAGRYQVLAQQRKIGFDLSGSDTDSWLSDWQQAHREKIETLTTGFDIPLFAISCNREVSSQIAESLSLP